MIFAISDKIDNITYRSNTITDTKYYADLTMSFTAVLENIPSDNHKEIDALKDKYGNPPEIRIELNFIDTNRCSPSAFLQYHTVKNINALKDIGFAQLYEANERDNTNTLFLVIADSLTKYNQIAPLLHNSNIIFRCGFSLDDNIQNYTLHIIPNVK